MTVLEKKLEISDITDLFSAGCKNEEKIGMEYERLPINRETKQAVPYSGCYGVSEFLRTFAREHNWDYIFDNDNIIGLKKLHDTITLEPGCQVELSIEPEFTVQKLKEKIDSIDLKFKEILDLFNMDLLAYGVYPNTTYHNIQIQPKRRYHVMADYLWGILSDVMMRETAGIQVGIDFKSEEDAMHKFYIANLLSPFMTAVFANSNIRGGVDTSYKSFRALAWLNTDNDRCGFATVLSKNLEFKDYVYSVLNSPMIFIERNNELIEINGKINFTQFMKDGYEGFEATLDDFKLHANLFFPEVRLRKFIEIRNHDCVGNDLQYAVPAFYKGIMYDNNALESVEKMLGKISSVEISNLRYEVPRYGLDTKINGNSVKDISKELFDISYSALKSKNDSDREFLNPVMSMIKNGMSPCDLNKVLI